MSIAARVAARVAARWLRAGYSGPGQCPKCRGSGFDARTLDDCPSCKGTGRMMSEESGLLIVWDSYPMEPHVHEDKRRPGPLEQTAKNAYSRFMHEIMQLPDDDIDDMDVKYREVLADPSDPDSAIGILVDSGERTDGYFYFPKFKKYEDAAREMAESDFEEYEASHD